MTMFIQVVYIRILIHILEIILQVDIEKEEEQEVLLILNHGPNQDLDQDQGRIHEVVHVQDQELGLVPSLVVALDTVASGLDWKKIHDLEAGHEPLQNQDHDQDQSLNQDLDHEQSLDPDHG